MPDPTTTSTTPQDAPAATAEVPEDSPTGILAAIPLSDSAPYASDLIYPAQPGLQFRAPDGTYCEMYPEDTPTALCIYPGEGGINAIPADDIRVCRVGRASSGTLLP